MKSILYAAAFIASATQVTAFWRLPCRGLLGIDRIDPLADYGVISAHAHSIQGGSAFSETSMEADLLTSNCTSCAVTQDHSAYWAPAVYFMGEDGTTSVVSQSGGMLV